MRQLRAVYPEKAVYTQQVGPGCCFGALALMLRFYFQVPGLERVQSEPKWSRDQTPMPPTSSLLGSRISMQMKSSLAPRRRSSLRKALDLLS
ncbi:unnamed protein product [Menidia menidia]|uniref:(Atlantic silverside) hypothetical protein n=1 Tax=Menidia menidia TaxID=238744 RepID=A0A8S4AV46_9TELE|nr:unnamed protein product [Menidia menidia]